MKISVIAPVYNEAQSLPFLFEEITKALAPTGFEYEIVVVDDGSKDGSFEVMKAAAKLDKHIKAIGFRVNAGQTAAIRAGIDHATGDVIVPIDSDLENDPADIPKLVAKLADGFDVVSGWRQGRWKGAYFRRKLPSQTANWLISKITKVHLHDYGCILKAYKAEVIKGVPLYGEMHRFIPAYAKSQGARVTEMPVNYRARRFGKSNYGLSRTFRVLLDLLLIKFLDRYMNRPIHFFGSVGFVSLGLGALAALWAVVLKLSGTSFIETPLPIFSALFLIVGVQLIAMGIIAEILMRTYYESQNKKSYLVKETVNI